MQANVTPGAPTTTDTVTGGTGAYANARGTLVSKAGANGSTDTLTRAGEGAIMANTNQREAVDIAPMRARPALALVLALLSIPGSTLAWDLPSGGIWIGLPLGIAAIVLGLQARRRLGHSSVAVAAIAISVLMIGMMVVWKTVELVS